jgi:hypothetical protein
MTDNILENYEDLKKKLEDGTKTRGEQMTDNILENYEDLKKKLEDGTKTRSVIDDMIWRAESKLPKGSLPISPLGSTEPESQTSAWDTRLGQLEEQSKKLGEMLAEALKARVAGQASDGSVDMLVGTQAAMQAACDALGTIVKDFNEKLVNWYQKSGCVANFTWKYADSCKQLEVAGVDVIVYRKQAPTALTIKEALDNAPVEVKEDAKEEEVP